MDIALSPGALQRIFQQYDMIRSHADVPPWQPEEVVMPDITTEGVDPKSTPEVGVPNTPEVGMSNIPTQPDPELARLGYKRRNWNDVRSDKEERSQKLLEERYRESHAAKLPADKIKNPNGASFAQDEAGMTKAYGDASFPGVYYDPNTRTEYIKGSSRERLVR